MSFLHSALLHPAYENDESICAVVAEVVPTYHPNLVGKKDTTYETLRKETEAVH
jgi:hypothetical protein